MSALAHPLPSADHHLQSLFLGILPRIETHAQIYFRDEQCPDRRADRIADTIALSWKWFVRLAERNKDATAFPVVLASFAARAVRSGRRVFGQEKAKDVLSPTAQKRHGFQVEALPSSTATDHEHLYSVVHGQQSLDAFEERLRDNTVTPVPDQVAFRIDFASWLATLTPRERHIIRAMAMNERTRDLSKRFQVCEGRISQLRREFQRDWQRYCGDHADAKASPAPQPKACR